MKAMGMYCTFEQSMVHSTRRRLVWALFGFCEVMRAFPRAGEGRLRTPLRLLPHRGADIVHAPVMLGVVPTAGL